MRNHKTAQENKFGCTSDTSLSAQEVLAEPPSFTIQPLLIQPFATHTLVTQFNEYIALNERKHQGVLSDSTLYPLDD